MTAQTPSDLVERTRRIALLTLLFAAGLPVIAILTAGRRDVEVQPGLVDWIFVAAIVVVTLATFGALVPWAARRPTRGRIGLCLSVAALLVSPVAFWTMVPLILGTAGAWLGHLDRETTRGVAMTAIASGVLAAAASVVGYVATS